MTMKDIRKHQNVCRMRLRDHLNRRIGLKFSWSLDFGFLMLDLQSLSTVVTTSSCQRINQLQTRFSIIDTFRRYDWSCSSYLFPIDPIDVVVEFFFFCLRINIIIFLSVTLKFSTPESIRFDRIWCGRAADSKTTSLTSSLI